MLVGTVPEREKVPVTLEVMDTQLVNGVVDAMLAVMPVREVMSPVISKSKVSPGVTVTTVTTGTDDTVLEAVLISDANEETPKGVVAGVATEGGPDSTEDDKAMIPVAGEVEETPSSPVDDGAPGPVAAEAEVAIDSAAVDEAKTPLVSDSTDDALPVVEDAGNPEPEAEVTPGLALLKILDSKTGIEEADPLKDSIDAEDVPSTADDAGVGRPEDSDAPLEPAANPSLDEAKTPDAEVPEVTDGSASPEDAEAEDAAGPVGPGVEALLDSGANAELDGDTSPEDTEKAEAEEAARPDDSGVGAPDDAEIALEPDGTSPEDAAMEEATFPDAEDSAGPDDVVAITDDSGVGTPVDSEATLDPDGSTPPAEVAPEAELSGIEALEEAAGNSLAEEALSEGWTEPETDGVPVAELSGIGRLDAPETEEPVTSLAEDGTPEV